MQKRMRGMISFVLVFLMAFSMPLTALAEEYDLAQGSVTVNAKDDGTYVTQENGVTDEKQTTDTVITQSNPDTATDNTITVNADSGVDVKVTIDGVNVESTDGAGMEVNRGEGSSVTVELEGDNSLTGGTDSAGLEVSGEGELIIQDEDGDGSLTAQGGTNGAGIGGGSGEDGNNITVTGGTVTATGGNGASSGQGGGAGIGGGNGGDGTNITVNGGTVTATGGTGESTSYVYDGSRIGAAGIGGGFDGDGTSITVNSGTVTARGGISGNQDQNGEHGPNGIFSKNAADKQLHGRYPNKICADHTDRENPLSNGLAIAQLQRDEEFQHQETEENRDGGKAEAHVNNHIVSIHGFGIGCQRLICCFVIGDLSLGQDGNLLRGHLKCGAELGGIVIHGIVKSNIIAVMNK